MDLLARYKNYDKRTQEAIRLLVNELALSDSYLTSLDLLAINYDMMFDAIDDIKKNGYTIIPENGTKPVKNHACQTFNNTQQTILKIINSFPANPLSKAHIKKLNLKEEEKSPLEEFLLS